MRFGRSRRLALSVGLSLALSVGTVRPIAAATVSSLTNETLMGSSTLPTNSQFCPTPTYSVSGTAAGPYPGSFAETGTIFGPTGQLHDRVSRHHRDWQQQDARLSLVGQLRTRLRRVLSRPGCSVHRHDLHAHWDL